MTRARHPKPTRQIDALRETAEANALTCCFLAAVYRDRPDSRLVDRLRQMGAGPVMGLRSGIAANADGLLALDAIAGFIEATANHSLDVVIEALAVDWTRLVRGVAPGYGPPPPYEAVYTGSPTRFEEIARQLIPLYEELGLAVTDRPDAISVQFDFLGFLFEFEAAAWRQQDHAAARKIAATARSFVVDHLGDWAPRYCDNAISQAETGFYRGILLLTKSVLCELAANARPFAEGKIGGDVDRGVIVESAP